MPEDETRVAFRQDADGRRHAPDVSSTDLSRVLSLSDGVFAFALTLLVLSITVPVVTATHPSVASSQLGRALLGKWTTFLGYAFAFVMIGIWWMVHNRTFLYIARYDSAILWLNLLLLAQIALMPFVLSVFSDYSDTQAAVSLFAGLQVTLGITSTLIWDYARRARLLKPNVPSSVAVYFTRRGYLTAVVFGLSIAVAFVSPGWAEVSWAGIFIVQRFLTRHADEEGPPPRAEGSVPLHPE